MSNLVARSITGIVFVVVILGSLFLHPVSFFLVFAAILVLGMWEFYHLIGKTGLKPQKNTGTAAGLILFLMNGLYSSQAMSPKIFLLLIPVLFLIYMIELFRNKPSPFRNISATLMGIVYVAFPLSLFTYLVFPEVPGTYNWEYVLTFFLILWSYDTGAYFTGIAFGNHKLWSRISPKKTWEGALGGLVFALLVSWGASLWLEALSLPKWMLAGLLISVAGTIGDLTESVFKRSLNIKDSGSILPGHGGILDRFDSTLMAAPLYFAWLQIFKNSM